MEFIGTVLNLLILGALYVSARDWLQSMRADVAEIPRLRAEVADMRKAQSEMFLELVETLAAGLDSIRAAQLTREQVAIVAQRVLNEP